ncbi:ABC transporter permease [Nonomuraea dietziae]|uniref:ABC transporter permease n=1 Tax=Nonomuraea dietziae TaxID=65515 RepID=UPI0031DB5A23
MPVTPPEVARPVVAEGGWLTSSQPDGAVVERSFARALGLGVGSPVNVTALSGARHVLYVRGIADSADQGFYPEWTPGLIWVLPEKLDRIEPELGRSEWVTGLRLADPESTQFVSQRVVVMLDEEVQRVYTWREVRDAMELDNRLLGTLLALFGIVGLVAAALALANAAGGRVLAQLRDLATLKSMGFTRGQVAGLLLVEHGALGLLGIALGVLPGWLVTWLVLDRTAVALVPLVAITAGTALVVLVAVGLPAWRGSRTPPIPAAPSAPPRGHLSRLAKLALLVRLPPALVLGARDAFSRRVPAFLTTFGLAVPMMMITIGLGVWATLDNFLAHPEQVGQHAQLLVRPVKLTPEEAKRAAQLDPGVREVYPGADVDALVPGVARSIRVRAIGGSGAPLPLPRGRGPDVRRQRRGRRGAGAARPAQGEDRRQGVAVGRRHPADRAHRRQDRRARPRRAGAVARRRQSRGQGRGAARVLGPGVEEGRRPRRRARQAADRVGGGTGDPARGQPRRTTVDHQGGHRRADRRAGADRPGQPADRQRAGAA